MLKSDFLGVNQQYLLSSAVVSFFQIKEAARFIYLPAVSYLEQVRRQEEGDSTGAVKQTSSFCPLTAICFTFPINKFRSNFTPGY